MKLRRVETGRVIRTSLLLLALAVVAAALCGLGSPASLALGGGFMAADIHLIRILVSRLIGSGTSRTWIFLLLGLKFFLLIGLVTGIMYQWPVAPLSFAFGASMLPLASLLEATLLGSVVEV